MFTSQLNGNLEMKISDFKNINGSSIFPATIGKKYFVIANEMSGGTIESDMLLTGATIENSSVMSTSGAFTGVVSTVKIYIVKATATSVSFRLNGNLTCLLYKEL